MQPGFQYQNCLPPAPRPQARHSLSRFGCVDWFTIKILTSLSLNCLTGEINITILVLPTLQRCPVVLKIETHNSGDLLDAVQFSRSVVSDSYRSHGLQHASLHALSITNSRSLLKPMSIESLMPSNHLILCHPLLLPPSIFPTIRVFSSEFFASGGHCIGTSISASVLPMNIQD